MICILTHILAIFELIKFLLFASEFLHYAKSHSFAVGSAGAYPKGLMVVNLAVQVSPLTPSSDVRGARPLSTQFW